MNSFLLANLASYLYRNQFFNEAREIKRLCKIAGEDMYGEYQPSKRNFEDDLKLAYDDDADSQSLEELFQEYALIPNDFGMEEGNYADHPDIWDNIDIINGLISNRNLPPAYLLRIQKEYPEYSHMQSNLTLNPNTPLEALLNIIKGPYRKAAEMALNHPTVVDYFEFNPDKKVLYELPSKSFLEKIKEQKKNWDKWLATQKHKFQNRNEPYYLSDFEEEK